MVGVSGIRDRQIELVGKGDYEIVVFGGWSNWERYFDKYVNMKIGDKDGSVVELRPEFQWQWKQNYPELVVEDIVNLWRLLEYDWDDDSVRDLAYAELLYRGINKWLFVRYLLVRYKKLVANWKNVAWDKYTAYKRLNESFESSGYQLVDNYGKYRYWEGYWRGYYDAMGRVRADLKTMAMTPRYVVWNGSRPGFVVDKKISRGWLKLVGMLYDVKFDR